MIITGFTRELLRLKSFIEGNLLSYMLDRFPDLKSDSDNEFQLQKRIKVAKPFGNMMTRCADGTSEVIPEVCVTSERLCLCAEAAAWDDDQPSAERRSEAHQSMHKIGLPGDSVYFAQKVMCQLFPAYAYCTRFSNHCFAFLSVTQNHEEKMVKVLDHLRNKGFLQGYTRPDGNDLNTYYQMIYELEFPRGTDDVINVLNMS